jgi:integrase
MTFTEAIDLVLVETERENSVTSQHVWRWHAKNTREWWGGRKLADVTRREVQAWAHGRRHDVSPATLACELSFFRRVYRVAWDAGQDVVCPAQGIRMPRVNNKRERVLSLEEEESLNGHLARRDMSLVAFAINSGIRRLEQFRLRPKDCQFTDRDFDGTTYRIGLAHITDSKTGIGRMSPLNPIAASIASTWIEHGKATGETEFVFWSEKKSPRHLVANQSYQMLHSAAIKLGIPDLRWHDLRHTAATRAAEAGATPREIQKLLGHASVTQTERYINSRGDGPMWKAAMAICESQIGKT